MIDCLFVCFEVDVRGSVQGSVVRSTGLASGQCVRVFSCGARLSAAPLTSRPRHPGVSRGGQGACRPARRTPPANARVRGASECDIPWFFMGCMASLDFMGTSVSGLLSLSVSRCLLRCQTAAGEISSSGQIRGRRLRLGGRRIGVVALFYCLCGEMGFGSSCASYAVSSRLWTGARFFLKIGL